MFGSALLRRELTRDGARGFGSGIGCLGMILMTRDDVGRLGQCYDRFSSPVGTENRGGSEVGGILTAVYREFGGCVHRCAGKPKRREQD